MIVVIFLEEKEDSTLDYWSECKTIQNCHRITKKAKVHFLITVVVVVDIIIITGLPVQQPSHKMGFRSSAAKNGLPGEGKHEGLVPRNDVLTNGFM